MENIKKTFVFGKIAYNNPHRRDNKAEIELKYDADKDRISICGSVWNRFHTDIVCGGQCLDSMYKYLKHDALFRELYYIWKQYHLNNMKPGTPQQIRCIYKNLRHEYKYEDAVEVLKEHNLYNDNGTVWGKTWQHKPIPSYVIERLKFICNDVIMKRYWEEN